MTKAELLEQLESLSREVRGKTLSDKQIAEMSARVVEIKREIETSGEPGQYSILGLKGLGKDYWRSIDVEKYLREERDSWE